MHLRNPSPVDGDYTNKDRSVRWSCMYVACVSLRSHHASHHAKSVQNGAFWVCPSWAQAGPLDCATSAAIDPSLTAAPPALNGKNGVRSRNGGLHRCYFHAEQATQRGLRRLQEFYQGPTRFPHTQVLGAIFSIPRFVHRTLSAGSELAGMRTCRAHKARSNTTLHGMASHGRVARVPQARQHQQRGAAQSHATSQGAQLPCCQETSSTGTRGSSQNCAARWGAA